MKIAVEITVDEREWFAAKRRALGPFAPLCSEALLGSLNDAVMAWAAHDQETQIHVRVLCDDDSGSHKAGGCCEPSETLRLPAGSDLAQVAANHEARLKALETWAARASGRYTFHEDDYLECPDAESVRDRLSELESRLPAAE